MYSSVSRLLPPRMVASPPSSMQQMHRFKHTVRVILTQSVGEKAAGEVVHVKAGFARNYLVPNKMALYAIPANFERLGKKDPDVETEEEKKKRLAKEAADKENLELIAANILQKYLRNKTLKIWRNVDPDTNAVHPGVVTGQNLREKLAQQLKIDLEDHEVIHISETPVDSHEKIKDEELEMVLEKIDTSNPCEVKIRQLGNFIAKISLAGRYAAPLKFVVLKR